MKQTIQFIPLEYSNFDFNEKNYMKIYGRTAEGKRACIIHNVPVYLYAILKEKVKDKDIQSLKKDIESIEFEDKGRKVKVLKTELENKKFLGRDVKALKIYGTNYKDLHAIADKLDFPEIECRREYDLSFSTRFIIDSGIQPLKWYTISGELLNNSHELGNIDKNIDVDIVLIANTIELAKEQPEFKPNAIAFDIETDEFEIGKGEIVMISLVSNDGKLKKVLTYKAKETAEKLKFVNYYKTEADMLEAFIAIVKEQKPDVLTGYFSDGFDLAYLRARANHYNMKLNIGLDNSQPTFARGRLPSGSIEGITHIDIFRFIEMAYSQYLQSETLGLNEVASELLGEKKHEFEFKHSSKIKKDDEWERYFEYNLQDSVLTVKLFDKIWPDLLEFSRIIKEPLYNISRDSMASQVENYIIHNLSRFNEIAEKRPIHDEISERMNRGKYEGAFVFQPTPGLYNNVVFFDFTSMYASVIVTFNLSRANFEENPKNKKDFTEVELEKNKAYFSKNKTIFPYLLEEIIKLRKKYKQELKEEFSAIKKARSNAYKLLANAAYGYQGFFGARYYCPEAAASTAALARKYIKDTIAKAEKHGFKVIYADTDSIAFLQDKKTKKQTLDFLKELNSQLPGIMELDLEDFYKRGIWVTKRTGEFGAKKKYALIDENNKLKIRGFETVRRDWCRLARDLQNKVLHYILEDGTPNRAMDYFKEIVKKLKNREIDRKQILIRTQLKKPINEYKAITPHVVAAQKMEDAGEPIKTGMLVQFFIAETREKKALVRDKVKLPEEKGEYNIKYYLENQLIPAVENIFETFNIDTKIAGKEIAEGVKQNKLF